MKVRWAHVFLALALLAPVALCVGCECKHNADCGITIVPQFVGGVLVNQVVALKCHDKECEP